MPFCIDGYLKHQKWIHKALSHAKNLAKFEEKLRNNLGKCTQRTPTMSTTLKAFMEGNINLVGF